MAGKSPYQRVLDGERALYFNHIPKTAGTSFYAVLDQRFAAAATCPFVGGVHLNEEPKERWQGYQLYRGHFGMRLREKLDDDPWMITMLREPFAHELSSLRHRMRARRLYPEMPQTLAAALEHPVNQHALGMDYIGSLASGYASMSVEEQIATACRTLDRCLFVGVTERFDDSMALLAYTMGWPLPDDVGRRNERPKDQAQEVPEGVVAAIEQRIGPARAIYEHACARFARDLTAMHRDLLGRLQREELAADEPRSELLLRFDRPLVGTGWHAPCHAHGEIPMRWTGPGKESDLELRLATDRDLDLKVHLGDVASEAIARSLTLAVNDVPVALSLSSMGGRQMLAAGRVPATALQRRQPLTRLRFGVDETVSPASDGADPARGVAFCQLMLRPA